MNCNKTIDFSEYNYPGETANYKTLHTLDYVKIVFISLIMAGTLFGNFCVIIVVGFNKTMRTVINIYMVNLASADLLVCSICMTSFLLKIMLNNHIFILGPVMCKLIDFCQMITLTCSVLTLSAIACDRANAILFPLRNLISKGRTKMVLPVIWLVSTSFSIPVLFVRQLYIVHFRDFVQETCGDCWPTALSGMEWISTLYYTFVSVTLFFLPVSIMTVTYSLILWRLSKAPPGEANEANLITKNKNRRKLIKMVFTVLIAFVICWMPIQILLLYDKYRPCTTCALPFWYEEALRVTQFLAYSNSFLNPIIYGGFNKDFRDNLCRLLKRCSRRKRRFGSSGFIQRFRTTLTTALSSSLRTTTTGTTDTKKRKEKSPIIDNGTAPDGDPQANDTEKVNEAMKDTAL